VARALLLVALGLVLLTSSARAADWSIKSSLSETVEASDNANLDTNPKGPSYNSFSTLFVDALALTPTSQFEAQGNLKYRAYGGPGEANQVNGLDKYVTASYRKTQKRTTYNVFGSYSETQTSAIQLVETGFSTLPGSTINETVGGGLRHDFSALDSLGLNTTFNSVSFTGQSSTTPFTSWLSTADWTHRVSSLTELKPSVQFQQLQYNDAEQTNILFTVAQLGLTTSLSPLLSFNAAAGGAWADASNNGLSLGPSNPSGLSSGSSVSWLANATLTYRWTKSLTANLSAARTVGPTTLGQFQASESIAGGLQYTINSYSGISFGQSFSHTLSSGGTTGGSDFLATTIAYSRQLAREWSATISYQYVQRYSDTAPHSNTVLFTINKNFTVLPP
jgi:hypothetical protein